MAQFVVSDERLQRPFVHFCGCPAGGAAGDEGSVCGADQGQHRWGGPEGADDLGAAPSAGPAAGQSAPEGTVDQIRDQTVLKSELQPQLCVFCRSKAWRNVWTSGAATWRTWPCWWSSRPTTSWPEPVRLQSPALGLSSLFYCFSWDVWFCFSKPVHYIKGLCAVTLDSFPAFTNCDLHPINYINSYQGPMSSFMTVFSDYVSISVSALYLQHFNVIYTQESGESLFQGVAVITMLLRWITGISDQWSITKPH